MNRRQLLRWTAGAAIATMVGCSDDGSGDASEGSSGSEDTGDDPTGGGACEAIPSETAGPFPGDGTNGANALVLTGIVRSDIRASIAGSTGTAAGVPLTITLTVVDATCAPLANHAVYVWHCDRDSEYSMYTGAAKAENYLRGVQETDADGKVTFTSIFPACYSGRWPHIHFEVYPSLADAADAGHRIRVSQLALPEAACDEVFATTGYEDSITSFSKVDLDTDSVFSDGATLQLGEATGDVDAGYVVTLTVDISA